MENSDLNRNEYSLSIRVSPDGFSLSIRGDGGSKLLSRRVPAPVFNLSCGEIVRLFETESGISPADYGEVRLTVESDPYVFVPAAIFKPQYIDDYFYFQHKRENERVILFNRIPEWGTVNVFSIPAALNAACSELLPETVVMHHLSCFLSDEIGTKEDCAHFWLRPKMLDAVVVKNGGLALVNSFGCRTKEDAAYFVLSIFDQLQLDAASCRLKLYEKENTDSLLPVLSKYIADCSVRTQNS